MFNFTQAPEVSFASQVAPVNPAYITEMMRMNQEDKQAEEVEKRAKDKAVADLLSKVDTSAVKINARDTDYFAKRQQGLSEKAMYAQLHPKDINAQADFMREANNIAMEADISHANRQHEQAEGIIYSQNPDKYYSDEIAKHREYYSGTKRPLDENGKENIGVYSIDEFAPRQQYGLFDNLEKFGRDVYRKDLENRNALKEDKNGMVYYQKGVPSSPEDAQKIETAFIQSHEPAMYEAGKIWNTYADQQKQNEYLKNYTVLNEKGEVDKAKTEQAAIANFAADKFNEGYNISKDANGFVDYSTTNHPFVFGQSANYKTIAPGVRSAGKVSEAERVNLSITTNKEGRKVFDAQYAGGNDTKGKTTIDIEVPTDQRETKVIDGKEVSVPVYRKETKNVTVGKFGIGSDDMAYANVSYPKGTKENQRLEEEWNHRQLQRADAKMKLDRALPFILDNNEKQKLIDAFNDVYGKKEYLSPPSYEVENQKVFGDDAQNAVWNTYKIDINDADKGIYGAHVSPNEHKFKEEPNEPNPEAPTKNPPAKKATKNKNGHFTDTGL